MAYKAIKFAAPTLVKYRDIVGLFFILWVFYFLFCDTSSDKLFLGAVKGIYWLVCKIMVLMARYPVKALGFTVVVHDRNRRRRPHKPRRERRHIGDEAAHGCGIQQHI